MTDRISLTKTMAEGLLKARKAAGISQYELADKLGWVRSKIKRLELGEVETIQRGDYETLLNLLKATSPKEEKPKKTAAPKKKMIKVLKGSKPFEVVKPVTDRRSKLKFFEVKFTRDVKLDELMSMMVRIEKVRGTINGVEHAQTQGPQFKKGEKVVVAIYPT